jgi:DNA excision repair protein ERCC-4
MLTNATATPRTRTTIRPCILIDSREQEPLAFANLPAERGTLDSGDYSVVGLTHLVAVERKSLPDLVTCCGSERDRFARELVRLRAYEYRAVVVESTLAEIEAGDWRSHILPAAVLGSVASWQARYAPFVFAGDHAAAARWVERFLFQAARAIVERYSAAAALLATATT